MSGPLFQKEEDIKRRMSQTRSTRYGGAPQDRDTFLSQMAAVAAYLKVNNPYPAPAVVVEVAPIVSHETMGRPNNA